MSAQLQSSDPHAPPTVRLLPLTSDWLGAVHAVEQTVYTHPWTRTNFDDSLAAGYHAQVLAAEADVVGYFLAMRAVDDVHLLNLTVAPTWQHQGWARVLLDALALWTRAGGAHWLWLEVRASNARAQAVYRAAGFREVGRRKAYYPAVGGLREDALVLSRPVG